MSQNSEIKLVSKLAQQFKSAKAPTTYPYRKFVALISLVPAGSVASYGQIAELANCPGHARQVVRTLHVASEKYELPWYRIINSQGKIGLRNKRLHFKQKALLQQEGIEFSLSGEIDMEQFRWRPQRTELKKLFKLIK